MKITAFDYAPPFMVLVKSGRVNLNLRIAGSEGEV